RMNEQYKAFTQIKGYMVAVNQEYAIDSQIINADDEVAIIPPVSGG
ncbi:MAG TPA: molybdopterin synthase sulfur carrier subunit, partial [Saprospirales bacterium]|nr:molybdopterin synthase sulfur carrier subunit [Saprospirales bacterium]